MRACVAPGVATKSTDRTTALNVHAAMLPPPAPLPLLLPPLLLRAPRMLSAGQRLMLPCRRCCSGKLSPADEDVVASSVPEREGSDLIYHGAGSALRGDESTWWLVLAPDEACVVHERAIVLCCLP